MDFEGMTIDELVSTLGSVEADERDGALSELKDRGRETQTGEERDAFLEAVAEARGCCAHEPEVTFRLAAMTLFLEAIWPPLDERRYATAELEAVQVNRLAWLAALAKLGPEDPKRPGVEKYVEFFIPSDVKWLEDEIKRLDRQLSPYGVAPVAP